MFSHVSLHDLNENEVKALYHKILPKGKEPVLFEWLPQRPLLLSYIYFQLRDDGSEIDGITSPPTPGDGWNSLLEKLSARETKIARGAQPGQIRRLVERVALYARTNVAEVGKVTSLQVAQAFRDVFEMEPDLSVQQILMRLPGLTAGRSNEDRSFIDQSFFAAAQAGTLIEAISLLATRNRTFIRSESSRRLLEPLRETRSSISDLTAEVVISALRNTERLGELGVALVEASGDDELSKGNLLADLFQCALLEPEICLRDDLRLIPIRSSLIPSLEIDGKAASRTRLAFEDSVIEQLDLSLDMEFIGNVRFDRARVGVLSCSSALSLTFHMTGLRKDQVTEIVLADATNADVLHLNIPEKLKVLKICLRKLFRQPGSGRKRASFFRGIGDIDHELVDECLANLLRHKIVYLSGRDRSDSAVLHPNRAHTKRANFLIDTSAIPDDVLLNY